MSGPSITLPNHILPKTKTSLERSLRQLSFATMRRSPRHLVKEILNLQYTPFLKGGFVKMNRLTYRQSPVHFFMAKVASLREVSDSYSYVKIGRQLFELQNFYRF